MKMLIYCLCVLILPRENSSAESSNYIHMDTHAGTRTHTHTHRHICMNTHTKNETSSDCLSMLCHFRTDSQENVILNNLTQPVTLCRKSENISPEEKRCNLTQGFNVTQIRV